jgi:hypothetical protein
MTDENCRLNVKFEWEKAQESLAEVDALKPLCTSSSLHFSQDPCRRGHLPISPKTGLFLI